MPALLGARRDWRIDVSKPTTMITDHPNGYLDIQTIGRRDAEFYLSLGRIVLASSTPPHGGGEFRIVTSPLIIAGEAGGTLR